jgi:XTP/dITP diphosphohydrolase
VLATRNAGKLRELRALCAEQGIRALTLDALGLTESPAEDGLEVYETFTANARAKAAHFAARLPGCWVLAEDSGLVVDALGGGPGVHSKRWTGSVATGPALDAENNAALMRALTGVVDRRARYVCAAVLCDGERVYEAEGRVDGRIAYAPRGTQGFGYDSYFVSEELQCTFAEASSEEKSRVSHRGRAVRAVLATWRRRSATWRS